MGKFDSGDCGKVDVLQRRLCNSPAYKRSYRHSSHLFDLWFIVMFGHAPGQVFGGEVV